MLQLKGNNTPFLNKTISETFMQTAINYEI